MTAHYSAGIVHALREFCGAVYGAQCLVAADEFGPRVSALMRYASSLLDSIDIQLLEAGLPPDASELASAGRLRDRFERVTLLLVTSSLRDRGARAVTTNTTGRKARKPKRGSVQWQ